MAGSDQSMVMVPNVVAPSLSGFGVSPGKSSRPGWEAPCQGQSCVVHAQRAWLFGGCVSNEATRGPKK